MQYTKNEVRDRIINVALNEFLNNGFEATSMRDIVKKADSSLGNVYRYFKNKEDLYNAITVPMIEDCLKNTEKFTFNPDSFQTIATQMVEFFSLNEKIFNILELGSYNAFSDFLTKFALIIARKLEDYLKNKTNNTIDDSTKNQLNILANAFINGIKTIMDNYSTKEKASKEIYSLLNVMFLDLDKRI